MYDKHRFKQWFSWIALSLSNELPNYKHGVTGLKVTQGSLYNHVSTKVLLTESLIRTSYLICILHWLKARCFDWTSIIKCWLGYLKKKKNWWLRDDKCKRLRRLKKLQNFQNVKKKNWVTSSMTISRKQLINYLSSASAIEMVSKQVRDCSTLILSDVNYNCTQVICVALWRDYRPAQIRRAWGCQGGWLDEKCHNWVWRQRVAHWVVEGSLGLYGMMGLVIGCEWWEAEGIAPNDGCLTC